MKNDDLKTPFEKGTGNQTCTYNECIAYYEKLDSVFEEIKLITYGTTSIGRPIHLVVISKEKVFNPAEIRKQNKRILLINNGIHPGEPDGIDASMMFARDVLIKDDMKTILDHVVICIIPVYNVSGMLNRGNFSRVNQNGPEEYGFRGTAQNYDLNRDFVKCDSKEAQTFTQVFQEWKPEIFVDTHVSNGADYQYTMTVIPSQKDKLNPIIASYQENTLLPDLRIAMMKAVFEMCPYVDPVKEIPDSGIVAFLETPRYSTGYVALFNCMGMMPETHMLKPYSQRVWATYHLIAEVSKIVNRDYEKIGANKKAADEAVAQQKSFALNWKLTENSFDELSFKGFEAMYKKSEVSDSMRLFYDQSKPFVKNIKYFNDYEPSVTVEKPFAYIIPQGWERVIERLQWNGIEMKRLTKDTLIDVTCYYVEDFKTGNQAFEGHYIHSEVKVRKEKKQLPFLKGDYVAFTDQFANRYIVEMLEPQGVDSYFSWNFFDPILQQKEWYSDYVWEDLAAEILNTDPELKKLFEDQKKSNPEFAKDAKAQLYFVYTHSPYYEKTHNCYPVVRIESAVQLPLQ